MEGKDSFRPREEEWGMKLTMDQIAHCAKALAIGERGKIIITSTYKGSRIL